MLEIDRDGFDQWDKRIIETLIHKFDGGPVGLSSLAVAVGEEAGTLEEVNEPYLIMEGYIKRTPQGRVATANAYRKLGLETAQWRASGASVAALCERRGKCSAVTDCRYSSAIERWTACSRKLSELNACRAVAACEGGLDVGRFLQCN